MDKKIRVFRFYYFRESPPEPMITFYDPEEKECLGFVPLLPDSTSEGFKWLRANGKFGKNEYLLEQALNAILSEDYRPMAVIRIDNDPDKLSEGQITYQIVAEAIS